MARLTASRGLSTQANGYLPIGTGIFQYLTPCTGVQAQHLIIIAGYSSFPSTEPRPAAIKGKYFFI